MMRWRNGQTHERTHALFFSAGKWSGGVRFAARIPQRLLAALGILKWHGSIQPHLALNDKEIRPPVRTRVISEPVVWRVRLLREIHEEGVTVFEPQARAHSSRRLMEVYHEEADWLARGAEAGPRRRDMCVHPPAKFSG